MDVILLNNRSQYYFNKLDFNYFFYVKVTNDDYQLSKMNHLTKKIPYNLTTKSFIKNRLDEVFYNKK